MNPTFTIATHCAICGDKLVLDRGYYVLNRRCIQQDKLSKPGRTHHYVGVSPNGSLFIENISIHGYNFRNWPLYEDSPYCEVIGPNDNPLISLNFILPARDFLHLSAEQIREKLAIYTTFA